MRFPYARIGAIFLLILIFGSLQSCQETPPPATTEPLNMVQAFPDLFKEVQMAGIFPDSKTFADCTPKQDPKVISEAFANQKDQP
ncbi:MAG: trehalase, partial [Bacteroidota bacterium]